MFDSFWIGGFEGADHVNGFGQPLDTHARNGHDTHLDEDYAALAARGIPFVFATGYGEASAFPERFRKAVVIKKPYSQADIRAALQRRMGPGA